MYKTLFVYLKYPSAAAIIATIWVGTAILVINQRELPVIEMITKDLIASLIIGYIGFRVDK